MKTADEWLRLVAALNDWTCAEEIGPGKIQVLLPDGGREGDAVIIMNYEQWDDMSGVKCGSFDWALEEVKQALLDLPPHHQFLLYADYTLYPSTEPVFRDEPNDAPQPGGRWVAAPTKGRLAQRPPHQP